MKRAIGGYVLFLFYSIYFLSCKWINPTAPIDSVLYVSDSPTTIASGGATSVVTVIGYDALGSPLKDRMIDFPTMVGWDYRGDNAAANRRSRKAISLQRKSYFGALPACGLLVLKYCIYPYRIIIDVRRRKEGFMRKFSRYWGAVVCLACVLPLLWAGPLHATEPKLTVHGAGPMQFVKPGSTLTFSVVVYDKQYYCPASGTQPAQYWPIEYCVRGFRYVNGVFESFFLTEIWTSKNPTSTAPETVNFSKTFTVPTQWTGEICFAVPAFGGWCWPGNSGQYDSHCYQIADKDIGAKQKHKIIEIHVIEFNPFPECPMCALLDLGALAAQVSNPADPLNVFLFYNGRQVALLGQADRGRRLPASLKINLPQESLAAFRNNVASGFQIRLVNAAGQAVATLNVSLKRR